MELIIFTIILLILKILMQSYWRLTKNHTNTLILLILDMSHKKNGDCMNINSVNPLYLGITHANGYIEEKDSNKYLVFDSTDENK